MSYTQNPRDFESPLAAIAAFYKKKITEWLKYKLYYLFGFIDGNPNKPCLLLGCGKKEKTVDAQTVLLLREALIKEPLLLDNFLYGWLVANADDFEAMSSSGTMKPKRRLGKKPKSTFITKKADQTSSEESVYNNVADAIDSVLK